MNSEQMNTSQVGPDSTGNSEEIADEAWDVFLPDGEEEPQPDEGDFWFDVFDFDRREEG